MAKNNRPERDPRAARNEDAPHAGNSQHQAAGGANAHSINHTEAEHEHAAATATLPQKKEQAGNSPTSMKSKKGNQPKNNQPKR
ncbi:hypothetical protein [Catellatospora vulcania]|uniref:hypothetical protein n=1 Tax=Catellatospora vulcania TaxID=1460450 RepID=UPI0012D444EE|nr:hypothetical protein [Catellatospora vulcania]